MRLSYRDNAAFECMRMNFISHVPSLFSFSHLICVPYFHFNFNVYQPPVPPTLKLNQRNTYETIFACF